jgi:hypothetical protein
MWPGYPVGALFHFRCLPDDPTDPEMSALERLALVGDRAVRIREIERELETAKMLDADRRAKGPH